MSDGQDRTEKATPKRMKEARRKGRLSHSQDQSAWLGIGAAALGVLADHIRELESDERIWARGRRLEAAQAAYDALLDEACRLAGIPSHLPPAGGAGLRRNTEPDRFEDELALAQRGWSW